MNLTRLSSKNVSDPESENEVGNPQLRRGGTPRSASIPAEAGIHESRPPIVAAKPSYKISLPVPQGVAPERPLAQKGNPTIQIPPLYYNPQEQKAWVYIVASKPNGTIYVGQTTNLPRRAHEHREGLIEGFSKKYGCKTLVYFEGYERITTSIEREDILKNWPRNWKIRRILATNPSWRDLYAEVCDNN